MNNAAVLKMMQICDSLFPIGTFTQSNGFETYVLKKVITDSKTLTEYAKTSIDLLAVGDFMAVRFGYEFAEDKEKLIEYDNLYSALKAPREIREGSEKICNRFFKVLEKVGDFPLLKNYESLIKSGDCRGHHPMAVGIYIKENGIDLKTGLSMFGYSAITAIITNGVKIIPLSQLEGQRILNNLFEDIFKAVDIATGPDISRFGMNGVGSEIYSMNHETLYSRLYMS